MSVRTAYAKRDCPSCTYPLITVVKHGIRVFICDRCDLLSRMRG